MCYKFVLKTNNNHELILAYDFKMILNEDRIVSLNTDAYYISKKVSPKLGQAKFGLNIYDKVIYNARSETLLEKAIFKEDYISHKAVFPSSFFFEKDINKDEHKFDYINTDIGYLAGFIVNNCFILLTRAAYPDLDMFSRLPIVLSSKQVDTYLESKDNTKILNTFNDVKFHINGISEQIRLF